MSNETIVRFNVQQRVEHLVTMVVFTLLCLTGLPQKFYTAGWAQALIGFFGGIDTTRALHRLCGVLLALSTVLHFAMAFNTVVGKKVRLSMVPARRDFEDAIGTLRYYLGVADKAPLFDRYDYRMKFEYWGLVAGNIIMVLTGFILYFPTWAARLVPGQFIPAAKVAHSNEGLMAFLVITIWHIYNAHLNPDVFPFDTTIFTGRISRERMLHEHPLELARMEGKTVAELGHGHADAGKMG
ncbi:MAG TPA: cytochrome b/b6 domain-containing protein [Anaeromyxobacteraceae bacterium]|nr:cytochrome b/b6 domain-containing protein [Anaeromyxobacteraceae bacterium]